MCPTVIPERILDLLQEHLNAFYQAAEANADASVITKRFDAVIKDASDLFALEELALRRTWSPDVDKHHQRHVALLNLARHVRIYLELGFSEAALPAILYSEEWLEQHLRGIDQPYLSVAA